MLVVVALPLGCPDDDPAGDAGTGTRGGIAGSSVGSDGPGSASTTASTTASTSVSDGGSTGPISTTATGPDGTGGSVGTDASTGAPTSSGSGAGSGSGSTGGPPVTYPACPDGIAQCPDPYELCSPLSNAPYSFCTTSCRQANDCPALTSGDAAVVCAGGVVGGPGFCFLICTDGQTCPDGMNCEVLGNAGGAGCLWPDP